MHVAAAAAAAASAAAAAAAAAAAVVSVLNKAVHHPHYTNMVMKMTCKAVVLHYNKLKLCPI